MTEQDLREELKQLHNQLEAALHKEPLEKDLLGHVMTDVVKIAQGQRVGGEDAETLIEQLEDKATDFESRHPKVAGVLRDISEILAKLGI